MISSQHLRRQCDMSDLLAKSLEYAAFIRLKPCLVCGSEKVDAHHMVLIGRGKSNAPSYKHFSTVPLCREHHTLWHSPGRKDFEIQFAPPGKPRLNLFKEALAFFIEWQTGTPQPWFRDKG